MNLLHTIGLMTRAEHEAKIEVLDDLLKEAQAGEKLALDTAASLRAKFKRAATDLAAQAEEIAALEKRLNEALCNNGGLAVMVGNLQDEVADLRPDAEAMRKKRAADRKRMAGKRGKA